MPDYDAVVVGAGPNGLAAAITLAQHAQRVLLIEGHDRVGGGTRTDELTLPGYQHDVCSTVFALGHASPFFGSLDLEAHGVEWVQPEIPVAQTVGAGAAAIHRDLDETVAGLGADGPQYRSLMEPLLRRPSALYHTVLGPVVRVPRHPVVAARFALSGFRSIPGLVRRFDDEPARALFAGLGGHAITDLRKPLTAAMALVLGAAAHTEGYPFIKGGSEHIARALEAIFISLGGEVETGRWIESARDLPEAGAYLLDLSPHAAAELFREKAPPRTRRAMSRFRFGPATFKVDYATSTPIPWQHESLRRAGTVHVGSTFDEIVAWERAAWRGERGKHPFLILTQPTVADPSRTPEDGHTVWAYAHVPAGSDEDFTEALPDQIERHAPGFRETIRDAHSTGAPAAEAYNPNNVGGDIGGGAFSIRQIVARPRLSLNPYHVAKGVYLCSASTPPGGGVHGMSGYHAAQRALRYLRGEKADSLTTP